MNTGASSANKSARMRRRNSRGHNGLAFICFIVPMLVIVCGLIVYPVYSAMSASLHQADTFSTADAPFVGLSNFKRFFSDVNALDYTVNSYLRAFGGVIPSYILGLAAALALHQRIRFSSSLRVIALLPFVLSTPVAVGMWIKLFDPRLGLAASLGLADVPNPLGNTDTVWAALLFVNMWLSFQFYTIILLAALQRIPSELYEAAGADGASAWQRFRYITFPILMPISATVVLMHFLASFQDFNLVFVATGGGPLDATQTLATYAYQVGFRDFDVSYASTITLISALVMLVTVGIGFIAYWLLGQVHARRQTASARAVLATLESAAPVSKDAVDSVSPPHERRSAPGILRRAGRYVWPSAIAFFAVGPALFLLSQSLEGKPLGIEPVSIIPTEPTLRNWITVLGDSALWTTSGQSSPPLAVNFINSIIVSAGVTLLVLITAALAGYGLSRWRNRVKRAVIGLLLVTQLVPVIVVVFPLYGILANLRLIDTRVGLILAMSTLFLPMMTLFLMVAFDGLPRDMEEAAAIDGAGPVRTFVSIVLPSSRPVLGAVAAYTVIGSWNEFLLALSLITSTSLQTFPPALQIFLSGGEFATAISPGQQAVYLLVPVIAAAGLLALTQRHFTAAYEGGAFKG